MASLPEPAREFLKSGRIGHLATLSRDGRPHVTCAWVGLDGDQLTIGTLFDQRKLRNMRRDARVTLSLRGRRTERDGSRPLPHRRRHGRGD
ncbi:MAG: pyridoxamine 5'-phosphate oxidase family protein [Actinomycetota bacterium]